MKPDTVLFGEMPRNVDDAYTALCNADYVIIVGTSFQIGYTLEMFKNLKSGAKIYYIDPEPVKVLDNYGLKIDYIKKTAVEGVRELTNKIADEIRQNEMIEEQ